MTDFWCPKCDNHVQVDVDDMGMGAAVEAWCCTAHLRPVRMVEQDPHAPPCDGRTFWAGFSVSCGLAKGHEGRCVGKKELSER